MTDLTESRSLYLDDQAVSLAKALSVRAAAFDRLGAMVAVLDGSGLIVDTNESWRLFARLNGGSPTSTGPRINYLEVCDRAAAEGSPTASIVAAGLRDVLAGEREQFDVEYPCPSPTENRWFRLQASSAPVIDGAGLVVFHVEITAHKAQFDRLAALASEDELTGLPNRRSAVEHLDVQLADASARGEAVWVLYLDVDDFKSVNDRHGHHVGDQLLVKVAERARRVVRNADLLCRFGGDEFVVVCPGITRDGVVELASRLRTVMAKPFQVGALELRTSISVGFASSAEASTTDSLVETADARMYVDKRRTSRRDFRPPTRADEPAATAVPWSDMADHEHGIDSIVAALDYRATHDGLTQLLNSASLHEGLERVLAEADDPGLVAVAVVNLDHFKLVNDRAGHSTGDAGLQSIADRLRRGLRSTDIVARIGGDEFVLVRACVRSLAEARSLGSDAMKLLNQAVDVGGSELLLTASIGIALSEAADSPATLIRDAYHAMHQAKHDGRNRITVFDHLARARADRRQRLIDALPVAFADGEFRLHYQPVLDLSSREVAGFEVLLRWTHPELGNIAPDEFIPLVESTGLILDIGKWVLATALDQLAAWRGDARVSRDLWIAINVSALQLAHPHFAEDVMTAIERADIPASALHLEITESVLMDRVERAMPTLIDLKAIGVRLSIDDFGTGYSSLSYLSRLPVDVIKIDRSFVSGLQGAGHDASIVRMMIALATTLSLDVIAEGIEHAEQAEVLSGLGCRYGQGFMWSPALAPALALQWMLDRTTSLIA